MPVSGICARCGEHQEDEMHCFYGCKCNEEIESEAVKDTAGLAFLAERDAGKSDCFWMRGIVPKA
eukprot:2728092-Lingulodinium_polyedra.AAC.1